jgi:hypothetical protein
VREKERERERLVGKQAMVCQEEKREGKGREAVVNHY